MCLLTKRKQDNSYQHWLLEMSVMGLSWNFGRRMRFGCSFLMNFRCFVIHDPNCANCKYVSLDRYTTLRTSYSLALSWSVHATLKPPVFMCSTKWKFGQNSLINSLLFQISLTLITFRICIILKEILKCYKIIWTVIAWFIFLFNKATQNLYCIINF